MLIRLYNYCKYVGTFIADGTSMPFPLWFMPARPSNLPYFGYWVVKVEPNLFTNGDSEMNEIPGLTEEMLFGETVQLVRTNFDGRVEHEYLPVGLAVAEALYGSENGEVWHKTSINTMDVSDIDLRDWDMSL